MVWLLLATAFSGCGEVSSPPPSARASSPPPATTAPGQPAAPAPVAGNNLAIASSEPYSPPIPVVVEDLPETLSSLPGYSASVSQRPTPDTGSARQEGAKMYRLRCATCHGAEGRGRKDYAGREVVPDLTEPFMYRYGSGPRAVYRTIVYGLPRSAMGASRDSLTDEQAWNLVHFVRGLQRRS